MYEINEKMLKTYTLLMQERFPDTKLTFEVLMNPSDEIIDEFQSILINEVTDYSVGAAKVDLDRDLEYYGSRYDEEPTRAYIDSRKDYFMTKEVFQTYIDILEGVYIYLVLNPTPENEEFLNALISADTENVVNHFLDDEGNIVKQLITCYVRYLMCRSEALITKVAEREVIENHKFIWNINNSKGYDTLSDMLRGAVWDLYNDLKNIHGDAKEIYMILDEFIYSNTRLAYFVQNGINPNNKQYLNMIKNYLIRVILADAYTDLKLDQIEAESRDDNEDGDLDLFPIEVSAIEYIESAVEREEYELPEDNNMRYSIYVHFLKQLDEITSIKRGYLDNLDEETKEKIATLNPLSVFD